MTSKQRKLRVEIQEGFPSLKEATRNSDIGLVITNREVVPVPPTNYVDRRFVFGVYSAEGFRLEGEERESLVVSHYSEALDGNSFFIELTDLVDSIVAENDPVKVTYAPALKQAVSAYWKIKDVSSRIGVRKDNSYGSQRPTSELHLVDMDQLAQKLKEDPEAEYLGQEQRLIVIMQGSIYQKVMLEIEKSVNSVPQRLMYLLEREKRYRTLNPLSQMG